MTDMIAPPMSGENLPFKELKPDKNTKVAGEGEIAKKGKGKLYLLFFLLLVIFFAVGIFFGLFLRGKNNQGAISPSASPVKTAKPEVSPSPSPSPTGLEGKIDALGENLRKVDLKEEKIIPPQLDFNIRFDVED